MKKKIILTIATFGIMLSMTGCRNNIVNLDECLKSPNTKLVDFEIVDENFYNVILVDENTSVLYLFNITSCGGITPILNADGTPRLYDN